MTNLLDRYTEIERLMVQHGPEKFSLHVWGADAGDPDAELGDMVDGSWLPNLSDCGAKACFFGYAAIAANNLDDPVTVANDMPGQAVARWLDVDMSVANSGNMNERQAERHSDLYWAERPDYDAMAQIEYDAVLAYVRSRISALTLSLVPEMA